MIDIEDDLAACVTHIREACLTQITVDPAMLEQLHERISLLRRDAERLGWLESQGRTAIYWEHDTEKYTAQRHAGEWRLLTPTAMTDHPSLRAALDHAGACGETLPLHDQLQSPLLTGVTAHLQCDAPPLHHGVTRDLSGCVARECAQVRGSAGASTANQLQSVGQ